MYFVGILYKHGVLHAPFCKPCALPAEALKGLHIKAQGWPRFLRPTLGGVVKGPNPEGVACLLNPFRVDRKCNPFPG